MRVLEQRLLLVQAMFIFIVAIPSFILSVVFMSLLGKENATQIYMARHIIKQGRNSAESSWALPQRLSQVAMEQNFHHATKPNSLSPEWSVSKKIILFLSA
jgi:hypothetical protein